MIQTRFVEIVELEDYNTFSEYYDNIGDESPSTFFWFIGTRVNGVSWCQDSVDGNFFPMFVNVQSHLCLEIV